MRSPKVSVCIPVWNGERFIAQAIESTLRQDFSDFELIVSDNASTDGTERIVRSFADKRVRWEPHSVNVGAAANFNRCLNLAGGEYLKILCADDILYSDCLSCQVAVFDDDTRHEIALVGGARDIIDEHGRVRLRPRSHDAHGRMPGAAAVRRTILRGTNIFGEPHAALFRTHTARDLGGFDESYSFCLDLEFWCRLLSAGDFHGSATPHSAFRVYPESWSSRLAGSQISEYNRFLAESGVARRVALTKADTALARRRASANSRLRHVFYSWLLITERLRKLLRCFRSPPDDAR